MSPGKDPPSAGSTRDGSKAINPSLVRLASRAHFEGGGANKKAGSSPASSYPRARHRKCTSRLGERFLPKRGPAYSPARERILLIVIGPVTHILTISGRPRTITSSLMKPRPTAKRDE